MLKPVIKKNEMIEEETANAAEAAKAVVAVAEVVRLPQVLLLPHHAIEAAEAEDEETTEMSKTCGVIWLNR